MHSYTVTIQTAECIQVNTYLWSARVLSVNPMTITIIVAYVYACENPYNGTQKKDRSPSSEMRCYRRHLDISYKDHVPNKEVNDATGKHDVLLTTAKKRKIR